VHEVLRSSGQPLDAKTRAFMEPRFGYDFSHVQLHTDEHATKSALSVGARAYTVGRNVVFGSGNYAPHMSAGKELLAHELGHVIQQRNITTGPTGHLTIEDTHSPREQAADILSSRIMASLPVHSIHTDLSVPLLARKPDPACTTTYKQATTFLGLVDLVRAAETKLRTAGITSTKDQIHALRGVYYGTAWSQDFAVEKSTTRNEGFQRFTRPSEAVDKSIPPDVQGIFNCGLLDALKASQDVVDGARHIDFGHLIIGLDARNDPKFASNVSYPFMGLNIDMGGTGTELVTWLGDLGGGAASLAINRVTTPSINVRTSFTGSDYGGSINLEGDVAGSVVATSSSSALTAPTFSTGKMLSDALQDYLSPGASAPSSLWKDRTTTFLKMNGGIFDASGTLTNRAALITTFSAKIQTFSCNYLASRVKDRHVPYKTAKAAADHVIPSSQEVSEAFVDALDDSHKTGNKIEAKRFPSPKSAQSGACTQQLRAAGIINILKGP
jgi:hypothetical protein